MSKRLTYEELEQRVHELQSSKTFREQSSIDGLIESIQAGVVVHGRDGAVIKSNTTAQMMLGLTHEQMLGKELIDPDWTFLREDGSPMPVEEYPVSRVIATKKPVHNLVAGIQRSDKAEPIWVLDTAIPEFGENGRISQIITSFMDISALKISEEKYRNLFENTMHEVHLWKLVRDEHGSIQTWKLVDINPAALKAWGKPRSEIIGKTTNEIFSYDATEQFMPVVEKIFSEGAPHTWETYFPPTDQFYHMTSVPFREYFISTGTDISERKKTEDALKESEERHRLFYNPSFGGSIIHDKGVILDCSNGVTSITGHSHNELLGMDGLNLIAPDRRDFVMDKINSGFEEPYETEGIRKDGTIFPLRLHAKSIQYHGKAARVVEFRDITEIKKKEEETQAASEFLNKVIDSSIFGMWISDKEGMIIQVNRSLCETLYIPEDKIVGKYNIFKDDNLKTQGVMPKVTSVFEKYQPARFTIHWQAKRAGVNDFQSARDMYIDVYMFPVMDAQGNLKNVVCQWLDITERKLTEEKLQESERKYRNIAESMPGMILKYKLNPDGSDQLLYISKGVDDLYEIQREDAVKNNALLWDRVHKDDLEEFIASVKKSAKNLTFWELEHRLKMPDGRVKWVRNRGVPNKQEDGSIVWDSLAVDITEQKQVEQALKNSEQLLRNIIDTSTDYIFVKDENLKTILCNKTFAKAVNKKPSDLVGKTDIENGWDAELVKGNPEKGIKGYEKDDLEALSGKIVQKTDTAIISGKTLFLDTVKIPLKDENNKTFGVLGISRNITEKKKAEQALKASEEQFRTLVNSSPFPIAVIDKEHEKILYWSKSAQELFGYQPKTAAEWFSHAYPDPQYRQEVIDRSKPYLERAQHSKTAVNTGEYQIVCRDGSVKICEIYAQFILGQLILTNNDITERKKAEEALKANYDLLQIAGETAIFGGWSVDLEKNICTWSDAVADIHDMPHGYAPPVQEAINFYAPEWREKITQVFSSCAKEGIPYDEEMEILTQKEKRIWVRATGKAVKNETDKIVKVKGSFQDITERKQAEAKILHLQKSESLGRMAGSVAHHFNNQLSVVMGNLELVLDDLPDDAEHRENLFQSFEAGHKAAEVSQQMLRYLGHISGNQTTINLSDVCRQSLAFFQSALQSGVTLNVDFPDSGPFVHADAGQIQQVLTNLFTNAQESVLENQGIIGLIIQTVSHKDISTSNRFPLDWHPQDDPYACLEISDSGLGISREDIVKIFDPFYTTKFTGRGMGLSVTMGILKTHNGCITVDSELESGSVFRVYLPVSTERKPAKHEKVTTPKSTVGNGGTVLLIEDEESVRNTAKIMIRRLGYNVIEAQDGVEAVRLFQEHQNEIDCVLSDLTMPRMNGWETLTALREKGADVPVILASGYDENTVMAGDHPELPQGFLNKPYSMAALKDVLMEVMRP